jgi:hypothetical protein
MRLHLFLSVRNVRRCPHHHGSATPWHVSQRPSRFGLTSRPLLAHWTPTGCAHHQRPVYRARPVPLGAPTPTASTRTPTIPWRQRRPLRAPAAHGHRLHNNPPGRVCPSAPAGPRGEPPISDTRGVRRSLRERLSAALVTARVQRALEVLGEDIPEHLLAGRLRLEHPRPVWEELGRPALRPPDDQDAMAGRLRRLLSRADKQPTTCPIRPTPVKVLTARAPARSPRPLRRRSRAARPRAPRPVLAHHTCGVTGAGVRWQPGPAGGCAACSAALTGHEPTPPVRVKWRPKPCHPPVACYHLKHREAPPVGHLDPHKGSLSQEIRLLSVAHALDPGATRARRQSPSSGRPGVCDAPYRVVALLCGRASPGDPADVTKLAPRVAGTPGLARAHSGGPRPHRIPWPPAETRNGGRGTIRNSREPSQRRVEARYCARLPALLATLPSPDREIVLLRIVAGVSIPNIVTALGVTPAAIHLTQRQALSALQPAAPAPHRPPATRVLPHARTEPTTPNPPTAVPEGAQA